MLARIGWPANWGVERSEYPFDGEWPAAAAARAEVEGDEHRTAGPKNVSCNNKAPVPSQMKIHPTPSGCRHSAIGPDRHR